jgi:hypothetical protein
MTLRVEGKIWNAIANLNDYDLDGVFSRDKPALAHFMVAPRAALTLHPNRYVRVINYENRSSWFPGSLVFGIGVGEKPTIVGGICSTG